jgi:acetyl esterase/lipase
MHVLGSSRRLFYVTVLLMVATGLPLQGQKVLVEKGIVYFSRDGLSLMLDLARPADQRGVEPAVIFLPGNGWGRWWGPEFDRRQFSYAIEDTAESGYVAIAIDYSPTSIKDGSKTKFPFPTQIYDVKNAIRWVRANANRYGIDSEKIGLVGWSSGGQLALLAGLTRPQDNLDGDIKNGEYRCDVQAVVSIGAIADMKKAYAESGDRRDTFEALLGGSPAAVPEKYRIASVVTYVRGDSPPILSIMGENDYPSQAELLDRKMKEVGATHTLVLVPAMGHANAWSNPQVLPFFDKHLKDKAR